MPIDDAANGGDLAGGASKPTVALLLNPEVRAMMLSAEAEDRLASFARVVEPSTGELSPQMLPALLEDATAALTGWKTPPITEELLAARPGLGFVAHSAGSVRQLIPRDAILRDRLRVSHAATCIAEAVAEFVLTQTLMFLRKPHLQDAALKAGAEWFEIRKHELGRLLGNQTVGLVGAGYVGRLVIGMFRAFSPHILVADPFLTAQRAQELGVECAPLDDVLRASDIVSLHAPVLPETRHMIGAAQLAALQDGALLINTARSALVDEAALLDALRTGRFTAALDVFDSEPLPDNSPFKLLPNVILSPHSAGHTSDTYKRQGATAVEEIHRFLSGTALRHEVTKAMLDSMA